MNSRIFFLLSACNLYGHAPVLPPVVGPMTVQGSRLLDRGGIPIVLRGINVVPLELTDPAVAFGVMRVRWNLNSVRMPAMTSAMVVEAALSNSLAVVLVGGGEAEWRRWGSNPRVLFEINGAENLAALRATGLDGPVVWIGPEISDPQVVYGAPTELGDSGKVLEPFRGCSAAGPSWRRSGARAESARRWPWYSLSWTLRTKACRGWRRRRMDAKAPSKW